MKTLHTSRTPVLKLTLAAATVGATALSAPAQAKPFDQAFIDTMTPHHQSAIMMAQMVVQNGSLPEVKLLARKTMTEQMKQVEFMKALRQRLYGNAQIPTPPGTTHTMRGSNDQMPGMMRGMETMTMSGEMMGLPMKMRMEMGRLMRARGREADRLFLQMMIPHHASAITMSQSALDTTGQPQIRRLAAKILDSNADEVGQMHDIYDRRFGGLSKIGG